MDLSDDELVAAFVSLRLPPERFDHRGHLRLAWIYLQRLPRDEAVEQVCSGIAAFAGHLGASQKFHRTLTQALMLLMHSRAAADPDVGWEAFVASNADLVNDSRGVVGRHYSAVRLADPAGRQVFLSPDCEPLPE